ncbi:MAG: PhnB protein [Actinomycetota bacterium]|nr:PhnB protein [Actinomycetota bacterium]
MAAVKPIPDNYPRVAAYLTIDGASDAIEFYKQVFGAQERMRMAQPDGTIGHAELQLGDSVIMMSDTFPEMGVVDPKKLGGTPVTMYVYVEDVDAAFDTAIKAGAKQLQPVEDKFYGDRSGQFEDPWGHRWGVTSHVEDVSPEEMEKRAAAFTAEQG